MATKEFHPLDIFLQLESDLRRTTEMAMRAVRFQPCVDMYETTTDLVVKMELAGVRTDKLRITLSADDRVLTIAGDRAEQQEGREACQRYYQLEIYFGDFEREVNLPAEVPFDREHIAATYRDGFLVITLPKREVPGKSSRVIAVQTN